MKLGIMQPYFFPYLGYFQVIHAADTFLLYDNVNYIKNGWINRNRLRSRNQTPAFVTVPIRGASKSAHRRIRDVKLAATPWRDRLRKRLDRTYRRSPFFDEVFPLLDAVLALETDSLATLDKAGIVAVCDFLNIETRLVTDVHRFEALEERLRAAETPALDGVPTTRRVARIVELCRAFGAGTYVNTSGGRRLYDKPVFRAHGIDLRFVQMEAVTYPQPSAIFYPDLSIIDVLMHCGRAHTRSLLERYALV